MLRRLLTMSMKIASAALLIGASASCGNTDSWTESQAAQGWSAQYGDAANSSYTSTSGATALRLEWSRSVKGELGAGVALGANGYLAANGQTAGGCSLMVWENNNHGRQRWCTRMVLGGGFASPLFDGFDNLYIGQPGMMLSYPPTQWIRWRQNVIGMPTTVRFLGGGQLLVITHLGQVLVFDSHRGTVIGTPVDLIGGVDPTDSTRGLSDCRQALPRCPVAAAPAFSAATQTIVVGLWRPDTGASVLTAMVYHPGQTPLLTREWTSETISAGVLGSPVLSADGKTVYVNGRDQRLWALDTSNGKPKWSVALGFQPQTPPTVSPGGLIVSGGGPDTRLVAVKDHGNKADVAWRREDVTPLATAGQAGADIAYTVVGRTSGDGGGGRSELALLVFDPADGHTVNSYPLPDADGYPVGVSVGRDQRVVASTSAGQVYSFAPA